MALIAVSLVCSVFPLVKADYSNLVEIVPTEKGYIRSNGTIEPPTLPIERFSNFYLLKGNIVNYTIEIQKSNTIFDGNGFSLSLPQSAYTTMPGKYGPALIQVIDGREIVVQNTTFSTFYGGVSAINSSRIAIMGNNFMNGRGSISLRSCSYCDILGNKIDGGGGLSALDSVYLNIAYNNVSRNLNGGCLLDGVAYSNITRNNIIDNSLRALSGHGIYVMVSSNNRFFENNFVNNPTAIAILGDHGSYNNSICRNYFRGNSMIILNTGGDALSGMNQLPLQSPASTNFELQLYQTPAESDTGTGDGYYSGEVIFIACAVAFSAFFACVWYYRRNQSVATNLSKA